MFAAANGNATPAHITEISRAVNAALRAETHNTGTVTVASGQTSVTISDARCGYGKLAILVPTNSAAAGVRWYLSAMTNGSMTFTFASATSGACSFGWAIIGVGQTNRS